MSDYRRLISYIYAYEGGVKGKNIGFAKLEARGGQCKIQVSVRRIYVGSQDVGVYLLSADSEILIGKIFLRGGSGEFRTMVPYRDVNGSGHSMDQCYGLTLHSVDDAWRSYTTIWEDAVTHAAELELEEATAEHAEAREEEKLPPAEITEKKLAETIAAPKESIAEEIEREIQEQENAEKPAVAEPAGLMRTKKKPEEQVVIKQADKGQAGREPTVEMTPHRPLPESLPAVEVPSAGISGPSPQPEPAQPEPPQPKPAQPEQNPRPTVPAAATPAAATPRPAFPDEAVPDAAFPNARPAGRTDIPLPPPEEEQEQNEAARLWAHFQRHYPKIQAFDYNGGCEILLIKPQDIGLLPRETWSYGNNSFLLHGYYNHRYLILARLVAPAGTVRFLLGVPGHYYSNEKYMASMFGFPNFVLSKMQPAGDGRFGYWYTDIRVGGDAAAV